MKSYLVRAEWKFCKREGFLSLATKKAADPQIIQRALGKPSIRRCRQTP